LPPSQGLDLKTGFEQSPIMTIQFHIRGIKNEERLRQQVEADLEGLNGLLPVASAHVELQHEREVTPAYQVVAMLAVSGPDLHAAARDHTWPAAWQKVVARLREQIEQRRSRQTARQKGQPHIHRPTARRA
jgi:ribosome-associated translation inhibitor RaiA